MATTVTTEILGADQYGISANVRVSYGTREVAGHEREIVDLIELNVCDADTLRKIAVAIMAMADQVDGGKAAPKLSDDQAKLDLNAALTALHDRAAEVASIIPNVSVAVSMSAGKTTHTSINAHDHSDGAAIISSAYGSDIAVGLDKLEADLRAQATSREEKTLRRLALAVIEITSDDHVCFGRTLLARGFTQDQLDRLGLHACERASTMAGGKTFTILPDMGP